MTKSSITVAGDANSSFWPWVPIFTAIVWISIFLIYYRYFDIDGKNDNVIVQNLLTGLMQSNNEIEFYRGKVIHATSMFALTVAQLWSMSVAILTIHRQIRWFSSKYRNMIWGIIIAVISVACYTAYIVLAKDLQNNAIKLPGISQSSVIDILIFDRLRDRQPSIYHITMISNLLTAATIILTIASVSALAIRREGNGVLIVRERIKALTLSVYSTGILLGLGIFEVFELYSWGAIVSENSNSVDIHSLANTISLSAGIIFSVLMAVVYLPVAVLHDHWLKGHIIMAAEETPNFKLDDWLTQHGLPSSPLNIFGRYMAMLVPVGMGLITKFLGA